jgi:RHS repeat-associated protein
MLLFIISDISQKTVRTVAGEMNIPAPQPFSYDLAGNFNSLNGLPVSYNQTNQLPTSLATYDLDGNTLTKSGNLGPAGTYTYDSAGHILTQKLSNVPGSPTISYAYDNMGHRVKRTVNGVSTFYVFAGDTLIGETDASGNPSVIYTWGVNGLISARRISTGGAVIPPGGGGATASASKSKAGANLKTGTGKTNNFATKSNVVAKGKSSTGKTKPIQTMKAAATMRAGATVNVRATASMGTPAVLKGVTATGKGVRKGIKASAAVPVVTSQTYYYHFGPSGETKQLTDGNGNVTDTYSYTAYGVQTSFSGTTENPFRFGGSVGYYSDTSNGNTGIILCTLRWYSPEMGRWLTRDPIGYAGGENLYEYCSGDPVNSMDPEGLDGRRRRGEIDDFPQDIDCNSVRAEIRKWQNDGFWAAIETHSGGGIFDYKILYPKNRYNLHGIWVNASQFGQYAAGYSGYYNGNKFGLWGVQLGGHLFEMAEDKLRTDKNVGIWGDDGNIDKWLILLGAIDAFMDKRAKGLETQTTCGYSWKVYPGTHKATALFKLKKYNMANFGSIHAQRGTGIDQSRNSWLPGGRSRH